MYNGDEHFGDNITTGDVAVLIGIIERDGRDYVHDVSLPVKG
jgi:hypothetical protein